MASKLFLQTSSVARTQARFFSVNSPLNRVENLLVIGSGLMGSGLNYKQQFGSVINIFKIPGIAQSAATTGRFNSITLQDVSQQQLDKAKKGIAKNLAVLAEKKRSMLFYNYCTRILTNLFLVNIDRPAEEIANRITTTTEIKPVSDKNLLVIEAVPEMLELKQKLFKNLS